MIDSTNVVKVVFIGESGTGKTSIINHSSSNHPRNTLPTVGCAFTPKKVTHNNKNILLGIWDTAGQEKYQSMSSIYFRNALICVLVFDLSDISSFDKLLLWKNFCDNSNKVTPIYILVGNKSDSPSWEVSDKKIINFCAVNNISHYVQTSAHNGTGIKRLFDKMAEEASIFEFDDCIPDYILQSNKKLNCNC